MKDVALASVGVDRQINLRRAALAYFDEYCKSRNYFPGVNAATLFLLCGDRARAEEIAASLVDGLSGASSYWELASLGESLAILGRFAQSRKAFERAASAENADAGAMSTTRRQMRLLCSYMDISSERTEELLLPLKSPDIAVFSGVMFTDGNEPAERDLRRRIDAALEEGNVGIGYGSLACGSDILFAEALLDRGAELQVVLPFDEADFLARSVLPGGPEWRDRYETCRARAAAITFATQMTYVGDPAMFSYGKMLAMGLARLRGRHLGADVAQYVVWDGGAAVGPAGTASDVQCWQRAAGVTRTISPGDVSRKMATPAVKQRERGPGRALRAIMFTDFAGFSHLPEPTVPIFWEKVMRRAASVFERHSSSVDYQNTWGDALYVVIGTATAAAEISLKLQEALAEVDFTTMGMAARPSMRIGLHYGPVYHAFDYVTGAMTFYGNQVSRAARIEPVTPPGCVYVTEPFAAVLSMEAQDRFTMTYVGQVDLAKRYGRSRMYQIAYSGSKSANPAH